VKLRNWGGEVVADTIGGFKLALRFRFVLAWVSDLNLILTVADLSVVAAAFRTGRRLLLCQRRIVEMNPRQHEAEERKNDRKQLKQHTSDKLRITARHVAWCCQQWTNSTA